MDIVYVETKNGYPINVDIQNAIDGFEYLMYDIKSFTRIDIITGRMDKLAMKYPFVGSIDSMSQLFKRINKYPIPIDFPKSIHHLLNRKISIKKLDDVISSFDKSMPIFVKSVQTKLFDGILLTDESHLHYLSGYDNIEVYVSEPIDIISEYRIFVHNRQIKYSSNYNGDFMLIPNYNYVTQLINSYKNQPKAYTIDVAILKDGNTTVIEFNDFWSIGSYGLYSIDYANMLLDRYNEIIK